MDRPECERDKCNKTVRNAGLSRAAWGGAYCSLRCMYAVTEGKAAERMQQQQQMQARLARERAAMEAEFQRKMAAERKQMEARFGGAS